MRSIQRINQKSAREQTGLKKIRNLVLGEICPPVYVATKVGGKVTFKKWNWSRVHRKNRGMYQKQVDRK